MVLTIQRVGGDAVTYETDSSRADSLSHPLADHNDERGRNGTAVTRDSEEFGEANDVVVSLPKEIGPNLELSVDRVEDHELWIM